MRPQAAACLAELRGRYGRAYNDAQDVGLESGYLRQGHWENVERWRLSAAGVCRAAAALAGLPAPWIEVLDVGCGRGVMVDELRALGARAWGIDVGDDLRSRWCARACATAAPFVSESFGCLSCLDVIEHVPEDAQAALGAELRRLLRGDGLLLATVPTRPPHYALDSAAGARNHYLCLPAEEWRYRLRAWGLEVLAEGEELAALGPPFAWGEDNYPLALAKRSRETEPEAEGAGY